LRKGEICIKILVITTTFPRWKEDTVPSFVYHLSKELSQKGLEISVIAPHADNASRFEIMDGMRVYRFPYFYPFQYQKLAYNGGIIPNINKSNLAKLQVPILFISELISCLMILKKNRIDTIHSHWIIPSGLIGAILKKTFKINHILTLHGSDINTIKKSSILRHICSFALHNADRITVNSTYTLNMVLSIDNSIQDSIDILPMGVDTECFTPRTYNGIKESLGANELILFVGRLIDWKGIKYLITSMIYVINRFPNSILLIGGDGPERGNLEKLIRNLNLERHVFLLGPIDTNKLQLYYNSADVFVLPSIELNGQTEALGVVLLEAMASGTPVIGSNIGGIPDIIRNGVNGFLAEPENAIDIANKIIEVLSNNLLREKIIKEAHATIDERYSWSVISLKLLAFLENINAKQRFRIS